MPSFCLNLDIVLLFGCFIVENLSINQDSKSSFGDLLTKDGAYTVHTRNIQTLAIELYKVWQGIAPKIMEKVFPLNSNAKYPGQNDFQSRKIKHVNYMGQIH